MANPFTACPHCGQKFGVPPEKAARYNGRTIRCSACTQTFVATVQNMERASASVKPSAAVEPERDEFSLADVANEFDRMAADASAMPVLPSMPATKSVKKLASSSTPRPSAAKNNKPAASPVGRSKIIAIVAGVALLIIGGFVGYQLYLSHQRVLGLRDMARDRLGSLEPEKAGPRVSLNEARRGYATNLLQKKRAKAPVPAPPAELFNIVKYHSPAGDLSAYLTVRPKDNAKHPAIIWIVGGFGNSIGDDAWAPAGPEDDQSARAFRQAGVVTMYPSLRGGNNNPGYEECFYGEVDDVLAAAEYLAKQDFVDPDHIYLGGHSTGGTLALLAAEMPNHFRAVFSFGPVADVAGYGGELTFNTAEFKELDLRSPAKWLDSVKGTTFVFEGEKGQSNIRDVRAMMQSSRNALIAFNPVQDVDHFSILSPMTKLLASKIVADTGSAAMTISDKEINDAIAHRLDKPAAEAETVVPAGQSEKGHSVIMQLALVSKTPSAYEKKHVEQVMNQLESKLVNPDPNGPALGTLEGHEFAPGECRLFFSCPDADKLVETLMPSFYTLNWKPRFNVVKRYGAFDDPLAKEITVKVK